MSKIEKTIAKLEATFNDCDPYLVEYDEAFSNKKVALYNLFEHDGQMIDEIYILVTKREIALIYNKDRRFISNLCHIKEHINLLLTGELFLGNEEYDV